MTDSARAPSPCVSCAVTIALVVSARVDRVCSCGAHYHPHGSAGDEAPANRQSHVRVSLRDDPADRVSLRRLLCELRPDRSGPFGWGPEADPPKVGAEVVMPGGARDASEVPAIPKGAFVGAEQASAGTLISQRLDGALARCLSSLATSTDPADKAAARSASRGVRTLAWLQRNGTLRYGTDPLLREIANALAPEKVKARWAADVAGAGRGAIAWASERVSEAWAVWLVLTTEVDSERGS